MENPSPRGKASPYWSPSVSGGLKKNPEELSTKFNQAFKQLQKLDFSVGTRVASLRELQRLSRIDPELLERYQFHEETDTIRHALLLDRFTKTYHRASGHVVDLANRFLALDRSRTSSIVDFRRILEIMITQFLYSPSDTAVLQDLQRILVVEHYRKTKLF